MGTKRKKIILTLLATIGCILGICAHYLWDPWGFYWKVSDEEADLRLSLIQQAESWLGRKEADGSHKTIIDRYNAQEVLPVGYTLSYTDSWCAAFVTASALEAGLTDIIPPECGCERQIKLWQQLGRWEERDSAIPLPGDLIYYDWDMEERGEATGWADHVGIVVGTKWPFVKVIEGNWEDSVTYRYLLLDDIQIRGFGKPDYGRLVQMRAVMEQHD